MTMKRNTTCTDMGTFFGAIPCHLVMLVYRVQYTAGSVGAKLAGITFIPFSFTFLAQSSDHRVRVGSLYHLVTGGV